MKGAMIPAALIYGTCAFTAGFAARDTLQDYRNERDVRVPVSQPDLWRPRCAGPWIVTQADGGKPKGKCFKVKESA